MKGRRVEEVRTAGGHARQASPQPPTDMDETQERPKRSFPRLLLALLAFTLLTGLLAMLAGLGSRWGIWHFRTGFTLLEWAARGALLAALLSVVALWVTRPGSERKGFALAVVALLISLPVFLVPWQWQRTGTSVPPIHDITTDVDDPPEFVDIVPLRADAPNPVEYPGSDVAELQREAYPDLRPVVLDQGMELAFERALAAVARMGWRVVAAEPEEGRIEATDRTRWFGFRDDVVIRLTPTGSRTIVDVRSKSRVGRGDVGTNARRIRAYLEVLDP